MTDIKQGLTRTGFVPASETPSLLQRFINAVLGDAAAPVVPKSNRLFPDGWTVVATRAFTVDSALKELDQEGIAKERFATCEMLAQLEPYGKHVEALLTLLDQTGDAFARYRRFGRIGLLALGDYYRDSDKNRRYGHVLWFTMAVPAKIEETDILNAEILVLVRTTESPV